MEYFDFTRFFFIQFQKKEEQKAAKAKKNEKKSIYD